MIRTWAPDDFGQVAQPLIPVPGAPAAGRRQTARRRSGGARRDRVPRSGRLFLAQAAGEPVRGQPADRAPPVYRVDPQRTMAAAAPAVPAPAQRGQRDRLVTDGGGLDRGAGGEKGDDSGPNPVDRGKPGSKIHVMCDRTGLPLTVLTSAANVHDPQLMVPLLDSLAPVRSARGRPRTRPANCTPTRPTTYRRCAPRSADVASPSGSPATASSQTSGSAATAGSSRPTCPGYSTTADSCVATNTKPSTSKPSPTSPACSSATAAGPRSPTETPP
jgi:hypothetical protein